MTLPTRPDTWDDLTDTQRAYWVLNNVGPEGRHSWELTNDIPSKNVSQRVKDLVSKGFPCFTVAERRNGRAGSRYWMGAANAPDHAVPVEPNFGADGGGDCSGRALPVTAPVSAEPHLRLVEVADYTGPEPEWSRRWERAA